MPNNVSGIWDIVQSNGYRVRVNIVQPVDVNGNPQDGGLAGLASEITPKGTDVSDQHLSGSLNGDDFEITVDWHNGSIGQYSGHFDPVGHLTGVTFDLHNPSAQATWLRA
jgi:hypothetical protein